MAIDVHELVREAAELDPLPPSALRLAALLAQEDWELDALVAIVAHDPALAGRVLGAANSAASGSQAAIERLADAALRLGPRRTLALALAAGTRRQLQRALPEYGIAEGDLWRHSAAAFVACELSASVLRLRVPPAAAAAALLHDVGKLVLARFLDPELLAFLRRARVEGRRSELHAELEVLEVSHGELGALVAMNWGLPESIAAAIMHHHHPDGALNDDAARAAALVQLADEAAKAAGCAASPGEEEGDGDAAAQAERAQLLERLELRSDQLDQLAERLRARVEHDALP